MRCSGRRVATGDMFLLLLKFMGGKLFSIFIELLDLCHRGCLVWQMDLSFCNMFTLTVERVAKLCRCKTQQFLKGTSRVFRWGGFLLFS
uniref:Uncharacterized protein n=1 Tax=Ixodes ricinus TaxID=34613 RepID=A0A6B0UC97_IXORI